MFHKEETLGLIKTIRSGRKYTFLEIGYGDSQVQVVCKTDESTDLTVGSFVSVTGKKTDLPQGVYSSQSFEITDAKVEVLSKGAPVIVGMCPPGAAPEVRLERRLYYFRDVEFVEVLRLSDLLCQAFRRYFQETKCVEVLPPSFTGVECEGGATLFKLEHPGKTTDKPMSAYLTQSSQFALEYLVPGIGDCYCIAPSYRAESSHTRRHLTEFTHIEAEWGGIRKFDDHLNRLRTMLTRILEIFLEIGKKSLEKIGKYERVVSLLDMTKNVVVLTHREAIEKCRELGIDGPDGMPFGDRDDIPEMQERKLIDTLGKIVLLVKFPKEFKSFYMGLDPSDESYVLGCDVEVPGVGEIIGSGIREADYKRLTDRLLECKLKLEDYADYLELRRSGFCQTSGMGLGLGRMLCWLLDKSSIRDVVAYPRFPGYLMP